MVAFGELERRLGPGAELGVAATLLDSTGGVAGRVAYKADQQFPMASVVKLPIAMTFESSSWEGRFADRITLASRDLRPGPPSNPLDRAFFLPWTAQRTESYADLFQMMLVYSDNTAADLILGSVDGPTAVNRFTRDLGIEGFCIHRSILDLLTYYYDLPTRPVSPNALSTVRFILGTGLRLRRPFICRPEKERALVKESLDTSTPDAMTRLLGVLCFEQGFERLLRGMQACASGPGRIARGLDRLGSAMRRFSHKTGTLGGIANDAGIVELRDGQRIAISVMSYCATASLAAREEVIASVASNVVEEFA